MGQVHIEFEEIPLIVEDNYEAGLVSGSCNVHYYSEDDDWYICEIYLDGYKVGEKIKQIELDSKHSWLYVTIHEHLCQGRFAAQIEKEIRQDKETARDNDADYRYELKREEKWA